MALWKKILIVMVAIVFSVSLAIGVAAFELTSVVINDFEQEIVQLTAEQSAEQLQTLFAGVRQSLTRMVEDTGAHKIAELTLLTEEERQNYNELLTKRLDNYLAVSALSGGEMLRFINIYMENGVEAITADTALLPYEDFNDVNDYLDREQILSKENYRSILWYDVVSLQEDTGMDTQCLLCVRFLYDRISMVRIGAIVAGIKTESLWQTFRAVFPEGMIVTTWGDVVVGGKTLPRYESIPENLSQALTVSNHPQKSITYTLDGQQQQALCWEIANSCAYFIVPLRDESILESSQVIRFFGQLAFVVAGAILVASLVAVVFSKSVTDGLTKLKKTAQRVANGERDIRFTPKKRDEVAYVGLQFNQMLDQLQDYYMDLQQYEKEKADLELSLLHAKINPHLLYNTLDIVVWAIKNNDSQRAEQLVYGLSDFFKRALAKGQMYATLEEEVALIKSYLELQHLVGSKDYRLQTCIDPDLVDLKILHLLLQPIVENSVAHGFHDFRDDGTIYVSAIQKDGMVELEVQDNGMGMDPEQVKRINSLIGENIHTENNKHYGLRNIARRIKLYYGKEYGIEVYSEMGEYTKVIIRVPLVDRENMGECNV